jgi:YVTN family beta-propeller protein
MRALWSSLVIVTGAASCVPAHRCDNCAKPPTTTTSEVSRHASPLALSADAKTLYTANADLDSVSVIDLSSRTAHEILLADAAPSVDREGNYTPRVMPRSCALSPDEKTLFVVGERSGLLYAIATATSTVKHTVAIGSEPVSVVASQDAVYATASQDAVVVRLDPATLAVTARAHVDAKPWALALDGDRVVVTHLLGHELSVLDAHTLSLVTTIAIPDVAPRGDKRLAHGTARGLFDVAARGHELWIANTLLATDTAQPALDFESTQFPALTIVDDDEVAAVLSVDASDVPGVDGAFADVVSAPTALAFNGDGSRAFVADENSDDVLVVDGERRVEIGIARPLPGHMPLGLALTSDGKTLFVLERNTSDVVALHVNEVSDSLGARVELDVDGAPIALTARDPMPATLRDGQMLFYSANSDELPITRNHWVACATCHMEGRSDAVTWRFAQGPRDTPSNAGGMIGTGFLFRTADRRRVQDYTETINVEQGGHFDNNDATQAFLMDELAEYVNHAIPFPIAPSTDASLVAKGRAIFFRSDVGCSRCHAGAHFTDSGTGNPRLDLGGDILLHDVGTCVTPQRDGTVFADEPHQDIEGHPREACKFDTPSLLGVADSAPYLHDGSAATLDDVLKKTRGTMGDTTSLNDDDLRALVEFMRSL